MLQIGFTAEVISDDVTITVHGDDGELDDVGLPASEETVMLTIGGMTCSSCSSMIENAVGSEEGVTYIAVNLTTERAQVKYRTTEIGIRQIIEAITDVRSLAVCSDPCLSFPALSCGLSAPTTHSPFSFPRHMHTHTVSIKHIFVQSLVGCCQIICDVRFEVMTIAQLGFEASLFTESTDDNESPRAKEMAELKLKLILRYVKGPHP